ncbi:MAG: cyclic nucleotide-binding domain-containing protein [Betaproteobacteria bacterium]|nr:cyclic nucleotide-binding domain-containing protein [Betaproteobacteria bacterium]MBI2961494.1 cyclic nucleotide-binding domain-containing protein [Betaproteobacteria bacterium]
MSSPQVSVDTLRSLEPICSLSEQRLQELAALCYVEHVSRNLDPFRARPIAGQTVYLVRGELAVTNPDGYSLVIVGGAEEARFPLGRRGAAFSGAKTITDVELLRIDDDLLDILVTWDQLAIGDAEARSDEKPSLADWTIMSGIFSISNLKYGAFSQLPPAHIEELLRRFKRIDAKAGEVIIREGAEGDYYYVIESGRCRVERQVGGVSMLLAELKSGDAFGEEALVSDSKRNATVTMKVDGKLLRLDRKDFNELLREPLLQRISMEEANRKAAAGAQWVDVRYPSEYQYDKIAGAMNIPLSEIRNAVGVLDKDREYILYCQSERRSSAAAFLLAQRGYRAYLLDGGLWGRGTERRGV